VTGQVETPGTSVEPESQTPNRLYIELLKRSLTGVLTEDPARVPGLDVLEPFDLERRWVGEDWPSSALTMIGMARLENVEHCVVDVVGRRVPGDLVETGVWRGGAAIFMRGLLKALGDSRRAVWAADSFEGVPKPNPDRYPADEGDTFWTKSELAVPLSTVRTNFERYGLLDEQVRFLPGWFSDTLPEAPIERVAVLRLDGDLYESTIVALEALYPKVSPGGYVIVDDYALETCRRAVEDFRALAGVAIEPEWIDRNGVYWQKR
jgi:hypothetical protein